MDKDIQPSHVETPPNLSIPLKYNLNPSQRHLELANDEATDEEVLNIFTYLQRTPNSLTHICISNGEISNEGWKRIGSALNHPNINIKQLDIFYTNMSEKGVRSLSEQLKWNTILRRLRFWDVRMKDDGVEHVAACFLAFNTTLTELSLDSCGVAGRGGMFLGEKLFYHNKALRSLDLDGNYFGNTGRVGACLGMNTNLTSLSLSNCGLGGMCMRYFLDGLLENTYLQSLNLSHNYFFDFDVQRMVGYIWRNTNLTNLDLTSCEIGSKGARYLGKAIVQNTSILSLRISSNPIGDAGGKAMAKMIKCNPPLRYLSLNCCGIEEDGIERICESLSGNTSLVVLHLCSDLTLSWEKKIKCVENIAMNKNLFHFDILADNDVKDEIEMIRKRNRRIWKERIRCSCLLNLLCRLLIFGDWYLPPEMALHMLWFLPPPGSLSEKQKKIVIDHACDLSTLGGKKRMFLEAVFGEVIEFIL